MTPIEIGVIAGRIAGSKETTLRSCRIRLISVRSPVAMVRSSAPSRLAL
jgi:hypothetical protein